MISEVGGNLLRAPAEALVNTVNTVGVMGKGIALQFKRAYPEMFAVYQRQADAGEIRLGTVTVWETGQLTGPRYVVNFPTKGHWRSRSRLVDIERGLDSLVAVVSELGISSIAIPPLGCGNGGLDWRQVRPRIVEAFEDLPHVEVLLYPPDSRPVAADMRRKPSRPKMTLGRAALVTILHRYTKQALSAPGLIETQKLMYFLQASGEPLKLNYARNRYGPYADNLRHVLDHVEGHFVVGFGDGAAPVAEAEALKVLPDAINEAGLIIENAPITILRIERVLELASGFESAYGLELLATVHWLLAEERVGEARLMEGIESWSWRKSRMFTPPHVTIAQEALTSGDWLPGVPEGVSGR